jgi:PAS domain S-box-containing protein
MTKKPTYKELEKRVRELEKKSLQNKQAETALEKSETKYRMLVENANSIIVRWNPKGNMIYLNPYGLQFFKYGEEDIKGKQLMGTILPEKETTGRDLKKMINDITTNPLEYKNNLNQNVCSDGTRVWVSWTNEAIFDANGKVVEILSIGNDVTRRIEAEQALKKAHDDLEKRIEKRTVELKESEQKFFKLFQASPVYMVVTTLKEGRILEVNDAFTSITSFEPEEVIGRTTTEIGLWANPEDRIRLVELGKKQGRFKNQNVTLLKKNGERLLMLWSTETIQIKDETCFISVLADITELKKVGEALKKSEEKFSKLFHASPAYISVAVIDEGRFLAVNRAFEKITGYTKGEVIDRSVYEIGLWADPNERDKIVKLIKKNPQLPPQKIRLIRKDNKVIEGLWATERIEIDGEDCIITVFDDMTQLAKTKRELRQSEEKFLKLFQANPIPNSVTTLEDGRFLEVNDAFVKDIGYQREEVLGRTVGEVGLWANPDERMPFVKLIKEKGRFRDQKVRFLKKNGKPFNLLWSAEKVEIDGRECLINANVDITDIEKAGKALRESEEKHRLLLETMNEGFHILDANTRTVYLNNKMREILGYGYDEIVDRPVFDFFDKTNRETFRKQFEKRKNGESSSYELTFIKKDGTKTPTLLSGRPTYAPDGQFTGSFAVITDISNLKQTQAALQKAHDELELRVKKRTFELAETVDLLKQEVKERKRVETQITASLNEKEVLLREVHHRVRNNLQVVSSLLELARTRTHNKEAIELLLESHARIHTMALIHSQLYQTDRFDKIHMQRHIQQLITHLSHLYDMDKRISPVIRTAGIHLSLTQAIPCALVLNEVISNVFKHAYKKGEEGTIEISMEQTHDNMISLKIKDHGGGIPQEIDVFETGSLGLKLTRSLVIDQLKGEMQVNRNHGTEVLIEFPRLKEGV